MIKGRNNVLEYFKQVNEVNDREYVYFSIYRRGEVKEGNPCIATPKADNWTYDAALQHLTRWLDLLQYGTFIIVMSGNEKRTGRGNLRQEFTIDDSAAVAGIGSIQQPGLSGDEVQAKITSAVTEAIDKYKRDQEYENIKKELVEMKKENKELERKANDPWNKFIAGISPYVPDLLKEQGLIPKNAVAGVPTSEAKPVQETDKNHPANNTSDVDDVQHRLEAVVTKFHSARPDDWLELLELIADAVVKNPSLADKVKLFL